MNVEVWMISKSPRKRRNSGQVLVEASAILTLVVGSVWINLELIRRAQLDLLLHHCAFLAARSRMLGVTVAETRREVRHFMEESWGRAGERLWRQTDYSEEFTERGGWVRLHARFPSLWSIQNEEITKHHFESTRKCLFPFSHSF